MKPVHSATPALEERAAYVDQAFDDIGVDDGPQDGHAHTARAETPWNVRVERALRAYNAPSKTGKQHVDAILRSAFPECSPNASEE